MHLSRSCPSIAPPRIRFGTHLLTQRSTMTVADRESTFSSSLAGRLLRLPISGAADDAVAAMKAMQQTAAVRLSQSVRISFCIGVLMALPSCHQRSRTEKADRDTTVEVMVPL